jgi:hypothetical protein
LKLHLGPLSLAYKPKRELERVKGIEPSSSAWKAVALPLSYTRIMESELVEGAGFEPA